MSFLPISILAYALNGGAAVIDKILLNKLLPSPFVYAFYGGIFGFLTLFLIPFGVSFNPSSTILSLISGVFLSWRFYSISKASNTEKPLLWPPLWELLIRFSPF